MKTIDMPTEGENVYRMKYDCDIGIGTILLAWRHVCIKTNKMLWIRNIVISNTMCRWWQEKDEFEKFLDSFKVYLPYDMDTDSDRGKIMESECIDQDTWWLLFEDNNCNKIETIFYSESAKR